MNTAVFADVHGRILLAFKVVDRYQRETGEHIDVILQCGDVGIFPDTSKLDRATIRHAESDPTELGFSDHFVEPKPEVEELLARLSCNMVCVRGNHEDHEFLDRLEEQSQNAAFPVDCYQRILVLKTGVPYEAAWNDSTLRILGIGRVGPPVGETDLEKPKYIQPHEQSRLSMLPDAQVDVLVTHDARRDFIRPGIGMAEISETLDRYAPAYHFFGHTGEPFHRNTDRNGITVCSKLSDFEWEESDRGKRLKTGCLGVLRWRSSDDHNFEVITASWLNEYTPHTWRYL